jgi:Cu(I)/Ag(I) efflux system periplasmic protein CusF
MFFKKMQPKTLTHVALWSLLAMLHSAPVQASTEPHGAHHATASPGNTLPKAAGEVRRIDTQTGKITLKHGEITNLDMPAMTMVFQTASPDLLKNLEVGQRVLFTADKIKGAYTVLSLERAP